MARELICLLLRLSGLPLLLRETVQRRVVTILTYHRLDPSTADRHFAALRRSYVPISLQTYLKARRDDAVDRLPPKSLIVTIDDGHESIYRLKDVFVRHSLPVTVFLCSGLVGTRRQFWFATPGLRLATRQWLKTLADDLRLTHLEAIGFDESAERGERASLDENEICELLGCVDFQSHTVSHPILPMCPPEKAAREIAGSKAQLEKKLALSVCALAYPNGSYTTREVEMANEAGYECALTMDPGFNGRRTALFTLRRLAMRDDSGVNECMIRACGLWELLRAAKQVANVRRWAGARHIPRTAGGHAHGPEVKVTH